MGHREEEPKTDKQAIQIKIQYPSLTTI
ncbi:uncharacterized protein G2W53_020409 [Senna tora]|uniref:Uncharacterized protein n=1 Tax=Senna tora TaxID=362788 RepID=A0A834TVE8_9FABA|nr:uncharacterized protein G2W53_020409 [Senna tora]